MEENEPETVTKHKRRKREEDTSSNVAPMDCSANDILRDSLLMDLPVVASSSRLPDYKKLRENEDYRESELYCRHLKHQMKLMDIKWKSIIPSLALWSHMQSLEFDFDKDDSYLLSQFDCGLPMEDKMAIVQKVLEEKRSVELRLYDIWLEESKEFWDASDDYSEKVGTPFKCDGKLVETKDGITTIYIGRHVFCYLTERLWNDMSAFAWIWNSSRNIYNLLESPLTKKDKLNRFKLRSELTSAGPPFFDILVSMKNVMEPKYHPLFRKELKDTLKHVWDYHTRKEMLRRPREEFPFSFFRDYSERMYNLFKSKVNNSARYEAMKYIYEHWEFISSPDQMKAKLESESGSTSFMSLSGESAEILHQMFTESLKEFKTLEQHCTTLRTFSAAMEKLFNEGSRKDIDSEVERLKSHGLISHAENLELYITSLEDFKNKWLPDLPIGYVVLGILLYEEGTALPDGDQEKFICTKVKGSTAAMVSYLNEIWRDSCYGTVYRDLQDPARVISWCDDETKLFPKSEKHKDLPLTLLLAEEDLKRLIDELTING